MFFNLLTLPGGDLGQSSGRESQRWLGRLLRVPLPRQHQVDILVTISFDFLVIIASSRNAESQWWAEGSRSSPGLLVEMFQLLGDVLDLTWGSRSNHLEKLQFVTFFLIWCHPTFNATPLLIRLIILVVPPWSWWEWSWIWLRMSTWSWWVLWK